MDETGFEARKQQYVFNFRTGDFESLGYPTKVMETSALSPHMNPLCNAQCVALMGRYAGVQHSFCFVLEKLWATSSWLSNCTEHCNQHVHILY